MRFLVSKSVILGEPRTEASMKMRRITACALAMILVARTALPDVIVMRNQNRHVGTIANRDTFVRNPGSAKQVSILVAGAPADSLELLRIAVSDIDYVVLEDGMGKRVFDLKALPASQDLVAPEVDSTMFVLSPSNSPTPISRGGSAILPTDDSRQWSLSGDRNRSSSAHNSTAEGVALVVGGLAAAVIGIAVKFGGPKVTIAESGGAVDVKAEEKSYNAANYALMIGGGVMTVAGILVSTQPPKQSTRSAAAEPLYIGVATRF